MKIIAYNGSPRKKWNTAILLKKALDGAVSQGAETEFIHLYDLNYKGCKSCFACKTKDGESYGKCAIRDDLTPILKKVDDVDAIILGSPIYFGTVSGGMRSFMERLLFPYRPYAPPQDPQQTLFPRKINTGFIYTMNATEQQMKEWEFDQPPRFNERILRVIFGSSESLFSFDTYQFEDYSKVVAERFDAAKKAKRRKEIFPRDCEKAYRMGAKFAKKK
jgi:multimeric flavodoxin WrbA